MLIQSHKWLEFERYRKQLRKRIVLSINWETGNNAIKTLQIVNASLTAK
jgi:hypothetical protein